MNKDVLAFTQPLTSAPRASDLGVLIDTTTVMPDGDLATVEVTRAEDGYRVTDRGQGLSALHALGVQSIRGGAMRSGSRIAEQRGLSFENGTFLLKSVSEGQLQSAVAFVADAARRWTEAVLDASQEAADRNLIAKMEAKILLSLSGVHLERGKKVQGESSKLHRFGLVLYVRGEPKAVFEPVSPSPASIAPAHLKFYDLMRGNPSVSREAVIEDDQDWQSADLVLMQQVASHVRSLDTPWLDLDALAA